jgi:beta-glucosidase-like glycosyl hydrolase
VERGEQEETTAHRHVIRAILRERMGFDGRTVNECISEMIYSRAQMRIHQRMRRAHCAGRGPYWLLRAGPFV